jgi:hypothetical protein
MKIYSVLFQKIKHLSGKPPVAKNTLTAEFALETIFGEV